MAQRPHIIRVNRDDLRAMLKGGYLYGDGIAEQLATEGTIAMAKWALGGDVDVILDNTNCSVNTLEDTLNRVKNSPFEIDVEFKIFDTPYWLQRWRNLRRVRFNIFSKRYIPAVVAREKNQGFQKVKAFINDWNNTAKGCI